MDDDMFLTIKTKLLMMEGCVNGSSLVAPFAAGYIYDANRLTAAETRALVDEVIRLRATESSLVSSPENATAK